MEYVTLSNGVKMPVLGYGVYQVSPEECERCVADALSVGYRLIDTAQAYFNEEGVGNAVVKSGIDRAELFITTKVWISNAGYEKAKKSIDESLRKLRTDYIDLLLIHQPFGDYYGTWRAMEEAYRQSACRIFIPTGSLIFASSIKSDLWSIRWKRMCSTSRKKPVKSWTSTAWFMSRGGLLPKGARTFSPTPR